MVRVFLVLVGWDELSQVQYVLGRGGSGTRWLVRVVGTPVSEENKIKKKNLLSLQLKVRGKACSLARLPPEFDLKTNQFSERRAFLKYRVSQGFE